MIAQATGADSASVIYDALRPRPRARIDVLIADTAGRLHTKTNLMDELAKITRVMVKKIDPDAPHEVMLVVDAGNGQNALNQAVEFHSAVGLTGITLTKLDGTAKGGSSLRSPTGSKYRSDSSASARASRTCGPFGCRRVRQALVRIDMDGAAAGRGPRKPTTLEPMIRFDNVAKRYATGHEGLSGVDLHLEPGDGLSHRPLGRRQEHAAETDRPAGARHARAGGVNGRNLNKLKTRDIPYHRREVGMIFQDHRLLHDRTVFDNIALPLVVAGMGHANQPPRTRGVDKVSLLKKEKGLSDHAVRRRTATGRHRPRTGQQTAGPVGRRTHRQPRPRTVARDHGAVRTVQPGWRHAADRHPRRRPDQQLRQAHHQPAQRSGRWRHRGGPLMARAAKPPKFQRNRNPATWALRRAQMSLSSLGRLSRSPIGTLMTAAVIGIALAMPSGLHLLVDNVRQLSSSWDGSASISLFLNDDVSDEQAEAVRRQVALRPDVAERPG